MATCPTLLGSQIQRLTTLPMKEFFLRSTPNLPWHNLRLLHHILRGPTHNGCLWRWTQRLWMPSLLPSLPEVLSLGRRLHRREHPFGQVPSLSLAQSKTNCSEGLETKRKPGCCSATLLCWNWCVFCTFLAKKPKHSTMWAEALSYLCSSQTQYSKKRTQWCQ